MPDRARSYSNRTLKLLFANSGNLCAFPNCTTALTMPETDEDDPVVLAQICHIYAAANNGPRGRPDLTDEERTSYNNLILLCGTHHTLVDRQPDTYTAELLKGWKKEHEAKFQQRAVLAEQRLAALEQSAFVQQISDEKIEHDVRRLMQARHLVGFPTEAEARALARRIERAEWTGGSSLVRARGLAWCARLLAVGDSVAEARRLLELSRTIGRCDEAAIAEAFITSNNDKNAALESLFGINSAAARSAALRIVTIQDKPEGAIEWVRRTGLTLSDLDSDGKLLLIMNELNTGMWDEAFTHVGHLTAEDFEEAPVLLHAAAMSHLTQAVPGDYRSLVLGQVPLAALRFPLAATELAMRARGKAIENFDRAAAIGRHFEIGTPAELESDYSLWLRLQDPTRRQSAIDELIQSMRDPRASLRRVNLALQFGIELDIDAIEHEIERQTALSGKGTPDVAFARLALCCARDDPQAAADYFAKYRELFLECLDKHSLQVIEVQLLVSSGQPEAANKKLDAAIDDGLGATDQKRLRGLIAEALGADPVAERKKQYRETGELQELVNLVHVLEAKQIWDDLSHFANLLFDRTRSLDSAKSLVRALNALGQHQRVMSFLRAHPELRSQSIALESTWAWTVYKQGRFDEAEEALAELVRKRDNENDRRLTVNLAIASGNWDRLTDFTNNEWRQRASRSAAELLQAGELAQAVEAPHGRDLVKAAAQAAPDDPHILMTSYILASSSGWENEPVVGEWLHAAAAHSDESGPIKRVSLCELVDLKPKWDKNLEDVLRQLNEGKLPLFGAALMLNRSLADLTLLPSLANLKELDARRRSIVYAFSGKRALFGQPPSFKSVALDLTGLFTLARLDLLTTVIAHYDKIVVPHSTFGWLFAEHRRAVFHQPSRVRNAREIQHLIAIDALRVSEQVPLTDRQLVAEVGEHLARLLEVAKGRADAGDLTHRSVIRPAPVHRVDSLMEEEADLSAFAQYLRSCQGVASALRSRGVITADEERSARSYLALHERPWANEPTISTTAELYLDDLAVSHLQAVGLLEKLHEAGFTAYVNESEAAEANQLISYNDFGEQQRDLIGAIRDALCAGLKSGRVRAAPIPPSDDEDRLNHPTFTILQLDAVVDALVVDDRFVNQHARMEDGGRSTPIITSLDLLADLVTRRVISEEAYMGYRTLLRRAGYQLIPVTEDELLAYLSVARVANGAVEESAELKAIRESLLIARMNKFLQLPEEGPWLGQSLAAIRKAIRSTWKADLASEVKEARSDWLLGLVELRGWAPSTQPGSECAFFHVDYGAHLMQMIWFFEDITQECREEFNAWVDTRVLADTKENDPEIFDWLSDRAREVVRHVADEGAECSELSTASAYMRSARAAVAIDLFPKSIRDSLVANSSFRKEFDLRAEGTVSLGPGGMLFRRSELLDAVRRSFHDSGVEIADKKEGRWVVSYIPNATTPCIAMTQDEECLKVVDLAMLAEDRSVRLTAFRHEAERVNLPLASIEKWEGLLTQHAPDDDLLGEIFDDLFATPVHAEGMIENLKEEDRIYIHDMVPSPLIYYERLVGKYEDGQSFADYIKQVIPRVLCGLVDWRPIEGYRQALCLGWQPLITGAIADLAIESTELARLLEWLGAHGDVISRTTAAEIALSRVEGRPELASALRSLIGSIVLEKRPHGGDRYKLTSSLVMLVYGEMARRRIHATKPPFWRRLAAFAQASLIERCLAVGNVNCDAIADRAMPLRAQEFMLQCYVDMRLEPRWAPHFVLPTQLRNECAGRLIRLSDALKSAVEQFELGEFLIGDGDNSLKKKTNLLLALAPGPLEGGLEAVTEMPNEILVDLKEGLSSSSVDVAAVGKLINCALVFRIPPELTEMASSALVRQNYEFPGSSADELRNLLFGLANLAAVERSIILADAVLVAVRRHVRLYPDDLCVDDSLGIAMIASASRADSNEWRRCVGLSVTDLAFQTLSQEDARRLHSHVTQLCHLVPELWVDCGQAEAALRAVLRI